MPKNQRKFFIIMGIFQVLFITSMVGWMLFDAYKGIKNVSGQAWGLFLREPIVWHKVGEILLVLPVAIAFVSFYMLWPANWRVKFLRFTTPIIVIGGIFNLIAAVGYYQLPRTDFSTFMIYFAPILFVAGLVLPIMLYWVHRKRRAIEQEALTAD
ncbi:MAG TPA: hypothetical protein VLL52_15860 [Anaerolineae bacterium]|nr:hypothetical protein [Anaerolineae bacterium]